MNNPINIEQALATYFGFNDFRDGQRAVIQAVVNGHSSAAIFPTGSGKSLCYQLSAMCLPHLTLVVSPLLALMQDQLSFLNGKGIPAASIDSTQTREQVAEIMNAVREQKIKILMISVERLNNERFRQFISQVAISLLVVDEAHCISEWGHNFRPDYLKLPQYQQMLAIPQALLLTATATAKVVDDMGQKFGITKEHICLTGSYRANLNLAVKGLTSTNKMPYLREWLSERSAQSGIIYVTLQQSAEQIARQLTQYSIPAVAYHAGIEADRREQIQIDFMQGKSQIIVATIAFGMGVDKSDIRFVVHYDLPKSIENYAQEIGRAGRDGQPADCLVLASGENLTTLENFVYADTPEDSAVLALLSEMRQESAADGKWELMLNRLSTRVNIRPLSLKTLLVYLEIEGVISPLYSYFAEYKYKVLASNAQLETVFIDERLAFVNAIFDTSAKAKIWYTLDLDALHKVYPCERSRVLTALDYMDQKGMIELQTKQMTQVYQVNTANMEAEILHSRLFEKFRLKEQTEVARIHELVSLFCSDKCLNLQLAEYFSDPYLKQACQHCSVCFGEVAVLPPLPAQPPLESYDVVALTSDARERLGLQSTPILLSRYLCGLTTPIFTQHKLRSTTSFALLEKYPFSHVLNWVQTRIC
ncbi:RecQ family ATP-dependent DNA helicase [Shewanella surugensis]|uniref:DNA 3'-5' helicase n=1 Tax=Shewanella surugensis TaxID=212020 RepID=A0ABT0LDD2_9GAMM|nr:RecQ family ATP-dependent DNA helicase [Shewanella surugensis]MCL1125698.1 RecQ family ATP-dependent DNA helicase [Shewanella surugensis]